MIDLAASRSGIAAALDQINGAERQAVELRFVEGLSYPEIAERLSCTEATGRARVSRGLRHLAELLGSTRPSPLIQQSED